MQLTRRRIAVAAIDLIERDGLDAVSMTAVATALGCGLMTLYHHVPSRAALVRLVALEVLADLDTGLLPGSRPEQIRTLARGLRAAAEARPRAALALAAGRGPDGEACLATAAIRSLETCGAASARPLGRVLAAYVLGAHLLGAGEADFEFGLSLLVSSKVCV